MISYDVLVTYAWVRSSYAAVRSLSRLGLKVAVADTGSVGMGQWSRFSHYAGSYRSPFIEPQGFIEDITHLLEKTGASFLLPSHDETEIVARYRSQLPKDVILPVANYEKIHLANDKSWTSEYARDHNLPVPDTILWRDVKELESRLEAISGPFVVKLRRGNSAKGVFYASTRHDVVTLCKELIARYNLSPDRFPIVQERISGEGWGVSCLYWHGQRIACFTHRRLREKTSTGGTSTLRESMRHPELEKYAYQLLDSLNWHGLAMVEFKYDSSSGQGWFIEINPRLWGSIHLAISSGVDFPALLYLAATRGPKAALKEAREQKEGVIARWYLGDLILAVSAMRHMKFGKALQLMRFGQADTLDDWHSDDPTAFLGEAAYYLWNAVKYRSLNPEQQGMLG